jgi:hypothetical protein
MMPKKLRGLGVIDLATMNSSHGQKYVTLVEQGI